MSAKIEKILLAGTASLMLFSGCAKKAAPAASATATAAATPASTPTPSVSASADPDYAERKAVNPDYVGHLTVGDNLVDQNIVQAADNEKYLHQSWDLQTTTQGAAFMDYRNTLDDQNIIIYGHYVYYDATKMFTPLEKLYQQDNYAANKNITLTLDGEVRNYVITDVYYYIMDDDTLMYFNTSYDPQYFKTYYAAVKDADFYDTGENLTMDDHWLTLQTCVRDHDELREIVLAKQVD